MAQPESRVPWSTGLFGCFEDVNNCWITCCCPCVTFGQIAEIVDKGATTWVKSATTYIKIASFSASPCFYSCFYRTRMRQQHMLDESPCGDCMVHFCCEACALCQEYRELQNRGFDMRIGWKGNVEKQKRAVATAPVVEGGMTR